MLNAVVMNVTICFAASLLKMRCNALHAMITIVLTAVWVNNYHPSLLKPNIQSAIIAISVNKRVITMKKVISIVLTLALTLSLCACGSFTIGPIIFDFDRLGSHSISSDDGAVEAPEDMPEDFTDEMPATEIGAPSELGNGIPVGDGTVYIHHMTYGYFSPYGYPQFIAEELGEVNYPYLFMFFTYENYNSDYVNIDYVLLGDMKYDIIEPKIPEHFAHNIDRYFGFDYGYINNSMYGSNMVTLITCVSLDDPGLTYLSAGATPVICINGYEADTQISPSSAAVMEEILLGYDSLGTSYESACAGAAFLWSIDKSFILLNEIRGIVEEHGDTGHIPSEHAETPVVLQNMFHGAYITSPAISPYFSIYDGSGAIPFEYNMAYEMYPELVDMSHEYISMLHTIADLWTGSGNYEEILEYINIATSWYYEMMAVSCLDPIE